MRTPTRRDWVDPDKTILLSSKNRQPSSVRFRDIADSAQLHISTCNVGKSIPIISGVGETQFGVVSLHPASPKLTLMALEALEQVCAECRNDRVPKTRALAFTLAYLWIECGQDERWLYDGFWKSATCDPEEYANWSRYSNVTGFLTGIYRSLGMSRTADVQTKFDCIYGRDRS